jgi:lipoprotein signal peptidase
MSRPAVISHTDILAIVMGLAMLLLGALIVTIYSGVSSLVANQIGALTNTEVTDYTTIVATYISTVLNFAGLALIIGAVVHIIWMLFSTFKQTATQAAHLAG